MSTTERVTLSLPHATLARLDEVATAERRSRSNAATLLLDRVLAEIISGSQERKADAASKAHLREHRRLSGLGGHDGD